MGRQGSDYSFGFTQTCNSAVIPTLEFGKVNKRKRSKDVKKFAQMNLTQCLSTDERKKFKIAKRRLGDHA